MSTATAMLALPDEEPPVSMRMARSVLPNEQKGGFACTTADEHSPSRLPAMLQQARRGTQSWGMLFERERGVG